MLNPTVSKSNYKVRCAGLGYASFIRVNSVLLTTLGKALFFFIPFLDGAKGGTERLTNLPNVAQLVGPNFSICRARERGYMNSPISILNIYTMEYY